MTLKLLKAAEAGDIAAMEKRLAAGDDIRFVRKGLGQSALMLAIDRGNVEAAQWLIEHGSPLDDACDVMGWTSAGWAAVNGPAQTLQMLRNAGADLEKTQDAQGRTPYLLAVDYGQWDLVRWFWTAGVDLQGRDGRGMTAHDLLVGSRRDVPADLLERTAAEAAAGPAQPAAVNPFDNVQPWPDEPWAQLRWPEDFPALGSQYNIAEVSEGADRSFFDESFHATMAAGLASAQASPTAAVRSWVWTQSRWEKESREALEPLWGDDLPPYVAERQRQLLGEAMIRNAFLHPKARRPYPLRLPDFVRVHEEMLLQYVQAEGANKVEVLVLAHHPLPANASEADRLALLAQLQQLCFTVRATKSGKTLLWRVDSAKMRRYGCDSEWERFL